MSFSSLCRANKMNDRKLDATVLEFTMQAMFRSLQLLLSFKNGLELLFVSIRAKWI